MARRRTEIQKTWRSCLLSYRRFARLVAVFQRAINFVDNFTELTAFEIHYFKGRVNYRLLFPAPAFRRWIDRERSIVYFPSNTIVGYGRWRANEYGTQIWRCFVLRTLAPNNPGVCIPGVSPSVEILLSTRGARRSKQFLASIDGLKRRGDVVESFSASYWRHLHLMLQLNHEPHAFGEAQRAAVSVKQKVVR
ncbi:DUF2840 domain-containing protein [Hyphococcus sp.]|uniref:DUF2840 domain-containing protein n=1 Tax=Hyphococcus sp. TaxID=2038636 RepID=UPI003CCC328C